MNLWVNLYSFRRRRWWSLKTKIGMHVLKRYANKHSNGGAVQFLNGGSQDMAMSPDPEQIFASLSAANEIREDNGTCSNISKV